MKKIKLEKIIDKYMNLISEHTEECSCNECTCGLKEQNTSPEIKVGKHNDVPDSEFIQSELKRGIEVEKEHTDDPEIAKCIAKDHLMECKVYYTLLDQMEKKCKTLK